MQLLGVAGALPCGASRILASLRLLQLERREGASPAASSIGASHSRVAVADLSERAVLPPAAAMGVTSAEKGDAWPPNMLAVSPKPERRLKRGAGQACAGCRASLPDEAAVVDPVPTDDIGVFAAESGQKLAGVMTPMGEGIDVGVGSRLPGW